MKPGPPPLPEYPRLHSGCRFVLHSFEKGPSWVLENPSTGKFFRMGLREERFARRLDGNRTLPELLALMPEAGSDEELSRAEAPQFLLALKNSGLLEGDSESAAPKKPLFNPMFLRIPFGSPDRVFDGIARALHRLPRWPLLIFILTITLTGAWQILANLDRFSATMNSVFSADNIAGFMAVFIALKVLHETAHGVACRYFGGRVPDAGLYFVFFVPLTYIDATASWRFPSKWVRILVSSAGMLAELVVAAIAGLVWVNTPPGFVNTLASNAVISASVTTLLFNANPLMRFDGYFILTDLTGYPNLYQLASKAASAWLGRVVLGIPSPQRQPLWITAYGIACLAWRTALIFSICIGAIALLHGIGIALALLTLAGTYLPVLKRIPSQLAALRQRKVRLSRVRLAILAAIALAVIGVPLEPAPTSPAVIEPAAMTIVRVQCPGFVREIPVQPGQTVTEGQLLLRLENPEEKTRRDQLAADSRRSEASANQSREAGESKLMAQQLEQAAALRAQSREVTAWLDTLSLKAPSDGVIYARRLDELMGSFLQTGREVLRVGSAREREAQIAVSQELFDRIRPKVGEKIQVFVPGRLAAFPAEVTNVESAATRNIRHESLTALAGGPLEVNRSQEKKNSAANNSPGMELLDPHFYVTARLDSDRAGELASGEGGVAKFPSAPRRTLLEAAIAEVRRFVRRSEDRAIHSH